MPNVQKRVCNVYLFRLMFHFACHCWWLGHLLAFKFMRQKLSKTRLTSPLMSGCTKRMHPCTHFFERCRKRGKKESFFKRKKEEGKKKFPWIYFRDANYERRRRGQIAWGRNQRGREREDGQGSVYRVEQKIKVKNMVGSDVQ